MDLSFIKGDHVNACAQLVVLSYPELEVRTPPAAGAVRCHGTCSHSQAAVLQVVYEDSQMVALTAPYVAGFLAFRETPSLLDCLKRLEKKRPDLLPQVPPNVTPPCTSSELVNPPPPPPCSPPLRWCLLMGTASSTTEVTRTVGLRFLSSSKEPNHLVALISAAEFGLACHLGVLSGLPCVGVAKNLLQVQGVFKSEEHQAQVINLHLHSHPQTRRSAVHRLMSRARLCSTGRSCHLR